MEVNEEKRKKFMEYAGKRVNNVLHDIQILEPMARSNTYDYTREDIDKMFYAMQETLNSAKSEFEKKFEEKAKKERKAFSFDDFSIPEVQENNEIQENSDEIIEITEDNLE